MANENVESQFEKTPSDQARRWQMELKAGKDALKKSRDEGEKVIKRFLDERGTDSTSTRWNLFSADIQNKRAMLYGKTPQVSVDRKFADARDDKARVAGTILERMLNCDIERDDDSYKLALKYALDDYLLPGSGSARVRYAVEMEKVPGQPATELAPEVPETERKAEEWVDVDYIHWKDILWSPARVWHEVRWVAFRVEMSREELKERFPKFGDSIPLNANKGYASEEDVKKDEPWSRAEVWEIWSKDDGQVYWYVEGFHQILDVQDDPLGLDAFFPCPMPVVANLTTSKFVPRSDYYLVQDLYLEIDAVSSRIRSLQETVKVRGVYDKANPEVAKLIDDTAENGMIPTESWNKFSEGGGLKGAVDWFPLKPVIEAMAVLRDYRRELVDMVYQVTNQADITRGQATQAGASATEQAIKSRSGSVRIQAMQDEFARFASDLQALKAEIICKRFDPATIVAHSNIENSEDGQNVPLIQAAVELLKSGKTAYRIQVRPEAIALSDFAALKQESMEVLAGVAGFFQATAPMMANPQAAPMMLKILQWSLGRIRGASSIEGVIDAVISQTEEQAKQAAANPQPPPPDPKIQAAQIKAQGDQAKAQADLLKVQADLQADAQRSQMQIQENDAKERSQAQWNVHEAAQKQIVANALKPPDQMKGPSNGRGFP